MLADGHKQIEVGDTVRLRCCCGPEMCVHSIRNDVARCTWLFRNSAQFGYFRLWLLVFGRRLGLTRVSVPASQQQIEHGRDVRWQANRNAKAAGGFLRC
jgi:hypothetical protein